MQASRQPSQPHVLGANPWIHGWTSTDQMPAASFLLVSRTLCTARHGIGNRALEHSAPAIRPAPIRFGRHQVCTRRPTKRTRAPSPVPYFVSSDILNPAIIHTSFPPDHFQQPFAIVAPPCTFAEKQTSVQLLLLSTYPHSQAATTTAGNNNREPPTPTPLAIAVIRRHGRHGAA